ncbi:hypothetical protein YC2023_089496 [Brassica napus]
MVVRGDIHANYLIFFSLLSGHLLTFILTIKYIPCFPQQGALLLHPKRNYVWYTYIQTHITTRPFSLLWPHSHGIANHFPLGHPSFHYSSPNTLNSGVLNGCVTKKARNHCLLNLQSPPDLSHALASLARYRKSLPDRSPILSLLQPSTLNSEVLNGCVTEKVAKSILLSLSIYDNSGCYKVVDCGKEHGHN